jgi:SM-20-related protein
MNPQWHYEQIANGLAEQGYAVIDHFLTHDDIAGILQLDEFRNRLLQFKKAGVGKSSSRLINEEIRGDYIAWIDRDNAREELKRYLIRLNEMISYLNENLFLSLKDYEVHMTAYPVGSYYRRHIDQFKEDDHRKLSVIFYLNEDWKEDHGGQLRMHVAGGPKDFFPQAGRFICFRSDQIEHEVLPSTRERLSLTGWILDQLAELRHL